MPLDLVTLQLLLLEACLSQIESLGTLILLLVASLCLLLKLLLGKLRALHGHELCRHGAERTRASGWSARRRVQAGPSRAETTHGLLWDVAERTKHDEVSAP